MTRLARHDEIVERMALGVFGLKGWGQMEGTDRQKWARHDASNALDAMLAAVKEMETGWEQTGNRLILQLEDKP